MRNKIGNEIIEALKDTSFDMCLYTNDKNIKQFWEMHGFRAQDDGTGVPKHYYFKAKQHNLSNEDDESTSAK